MLKKLWHYIGNKGFMIKWTKKFKAPKKTWKQKQKDKADANSC